MIPVVVLILYPPVMPTDAWNFGASRDQTQANYHMACRFLSYAEDHRWAYRPGDADAVLAEARWRKQCWDRLDDAQIALGNSIPVTAIRHLDALRDLLGDEAYFQGLMPDPWPLAYFQEVP